MDQYLNRLKRLAHIDPNNPEVRGRLVRAEEQAGADFDGLSLAEWAQKIGVWDDKTRGMAVRTVTESGAASAPYLHELVHNSEDFWTRYRALEALGRIGSLTVGTLIRALSDKCSSMRYLAARLLRKNEELSHREALPALLKSMNDEKWYVRREVALALGAIGRQVKVSAAGLVDLGELRSQIRARLEDPDPRVREEIEAILSQL